LGGKEKTQLLRRLAILLFVALLTLSGSAIAYDPVIATYTWDAATPNYNPSATIYSGTIDLTALVISDFLGVAVDQPNASAYGDSGTSVNWDDSFSAGVGDPNTNGDHLDGLYAQLISPAEGWWDLGLSTNRVVVFLSQDHGPYLEEGLEVRVYGSNDVWGTVSSQADVTEVYVDGWRPHNATEDGNGNGWCSDDIAGVFELPGTYRYVKITAWNSTGNLSEPEVDAVAAMLIPVFVDIKPGSWPNPLNKRARGVLPVAICGTHAFDVTTLDPATVKITREGFAGGALPLRWSYEDVATPYTGDPGGGHELGGDGYLDLVLHYRVQEIVAALDLCEITRRDTIPLMAEGTLFAEFGGTPIQGHDYVRTLAPMHVRQGRFFPLSISS
jgi:hypothetical protein